MSPHELERWAEVRKQGRTRFVLPYVLLMAFIPLGSWAIDLFWNGFQGRWSVGGLCPTFGGALVGGLVAQALFARLWDRREREYRAAMTTPTPPPDDDAP